MSVRGAAAAWSPLPRHRALHKLWLWPLALLVALSGACSRQRMQTRDESPALVALDLGRVQVGQRALAKTVVPVGRVAVLLELEDAPVDVDAPSRLFSRPGEETRISLRWQPSSPGWLNDSVVYRMSVGPTETTFRILLHGRAWEQEPDHANEVDAEGEADAGSDAGASILPCQRDEECDDHEPCTTDTCAGPLGCRSAPKDEGKPCGPFDCTRGHFCSAGQCAEVDMREVSDGMACDDADPCTLDGTCRDGLCYASSDPRAPKLLDSMPTFGEGMSDVAHAAGTYVFVGLDRVDVVREQEGSLQHRARLALPGVSFVESAGKARFLVRTQAGQVLRLDTDVPESPKLTPLPHIVPMPLRPGDDGTLRAQFEAKWVVSGDWVVISTSTWNDAIVNSSYYAATVAPIAPGPGRALDVPLYRMVGEGELLAWAQPGIGGHGDDVLGVLRLQNGKVIADMRVKRAQLAAAGCTPPKFVAMSNGLVATLSNSDMSGNSTLCLWRVDANAQSLSFAAAHPLYDRPQEPAIALDAEALYLSSVTWWAPGFFGPLMAKGQVKRFPLAQLLGSSDVLAFQGSPQIGPHSAGLLKLAEERLLVIGDAISVLRPDGTLLTGPGHGQISGALALAEGRQALVGGRTSFGLLTLEDHPPRLIRGPWQQHYPKGGASSGDLRVLRGEGRAKNLTPVALSPSVNITSVEQLSAQLSPAGALQITAQPRTLSLGYGWISSIVTPEAYVFHVAGSLLVFSEGDTNLPSLTHTLPSWQRGSESYADVFLRATSNDRSSIVTIMQGERLTLVNPVLNSEGVTLPTQLLPTPEERSDLYPYAWLPSSFAVLGDGVLRMEGHALVQYSRQGRFAPVKLTFADLDLRQPGLIPAFGPDWALVSYQDSRGQNWLVQVRVEDGVLEAFDRLPIDGSVASADRVGEHWIIGTSAGVQLVDLACFPGDER